MRKNARVLAMIAEARAEGSAIMRYFTMKLTAAALQPGVPFGELKSDGASKAR